MSCNIRKSPGCTLHFTSNASMTKYFSNAKSSLFDSPTEQTIVDYFRNVDEENEQRDAASQQNSSDALNSFSDQHAPPITIEDTFTSIFAPPIKFLIFQYLSNDLLSVLGKHQVKEGSFLVQYRESYQSLASTIGTLHAHFERSPVVNQLAFNPFFIQRDSKKHQKLWFRDIFGLQYYAVWQCALRWMLRNQCVALSKTNGELSTPSDASGFFLLKGLLKLREASVGVLLCQGGYFAGGIWKNAHCHTHKTFHSYVVRKKQGKRQATRDKTKRGQSVGAEMRRQNESHFKETLSRVLLEWKPLLDECSMLIIYSPGPINRSYMFGNDSHLNEDDERICSMPFRAEGNPNFQKATEVYNKLTKLSTLYAANAPTTEGEMSRYEKLRILEAVERNSEEEGEDFGY